MKRKPREPIPLRSQLTLRTRGGMDAPFPHFARELRIRKKNCVSRKRKTREEGIKAVFQKQQFYIGGGNVTNFLLFLWIEGMEGASKKSDRKILVVRLDPFTFSMPSSKRSNQAWNRSLCRADVNHEEQGKIGVNIGENIGGSIERIYEHCVEG